MSEKDPQSEAEVAEIAKLRKEADDLWAKGHKSASTELHRQAGLLADSLGLSVTQCPTCMVFMSKKHIKAHICRGKPT